MSLVLTKRCYRVSNQYPSLFTAAYLSIFSSRTEKGRQDEGKKKSEKVMERVADSERERGRI